VLGVVVYLAFRAPDVPVVAWMPRSVTAACRDTVGRLPLPRVLAGSLPDALWAWAFGASLALVWRRRSWREKAPWLAAGAALALGTELGQALGLMSGTFDVLDLVALGVGYVLGVILAGLHGRR
jgi:peptidoglycan/LPS O-acetylase OafA/YrhL